MEEPSKLPMRAKSHNENICVKVDTLLSEDKIEELRKRRRKEKHLRKRVKYPAKALKVQIQREHKGAVRALFGVPRLAVKKTSGNAITLHKETIVYQHPPWEELVAFRQAVGRAYMVHSEWRVYEIECTNATLYYIRHLTHKNDTYIVVISQLRDGNFVRRANEGLINAVNAQIISMAQ